MGENKKGVNLVVIFLVIAIVIILVMGCYIISLLNAEKIQNDNIPGLNSAQMFNTSKEVENSIDEKSFSNEEIKKSLQNFYDVISIKQNSAAELLVKLGLIEEKDSSSYPNFIEGNKYVKTKIDYSDFEEKLCEYMSKDMINEYFSTYKNVDEYLSYFQITGEAGHNIVEKIEEKDNTYYAELKFSENAQSESIKISFDIESYKGKCVISNIDYLN